MTLEDPNGGPSSTADVFEALRRFHVFDHETGEWVMSGCDLGDRAIVKHHNHDDEPTAFDSAETLVAGRDDLSLVWEDGDDGSVRETVVDLETASMAADTIVQALSRDLDVHEDRVRVVGLEAPNRVRYFITAPVEHDGEGVDR